MRFLCGLLTGHQLGGWSYASLTRRQRECWCRAHRVTWPIPFALPPERD